MKKVLQRDRNPQASEKLFYLLLSHFFIISKSGSEKLKEKKNQRALLCDDIPSNWLLAALISETRFHEDPPLLICTLFSTLEWKMSA